MQFLKRLLVYLIVLLARVFFFFFNCNLNMGQALRLGQCGPESSLGEMQRDVTLWWMIMLTNNQTTQGKRNFADHVALK